MQHEPDTTTGLSKKALQLLEGLCAVYIDYYQNAKGELPPCVRLSRSQWDMLSKAMKGDLQPGDTYKGVPLVQEASS